MFYTFIKCLNVCVKWGQFYSRICDIDIMMAINLSTKHNITNHSALLNSTISTGVIVYLKLCVFRIRHCLSTEYNNIRQQII